MLNVTVRSIQEHSLSPTPHPSFDIFIRC